MFGIRQKLILGFGGLLAILLLVGALSRQSLHDYRDTLKRIFSENYDSVLYGQRMKEAVEAMDDASASVSRGGALPSTRPVGDWVAQFQQNLDKEQHNITLPGEGELVATLTSIWSGSAGYRSAMEQIQQNESNSRNNRGKIEQLSAQLKETAQAIIDINVKNMGFANAEVASSEAKVERTLYILIAAGVLLGVLFVSVISRSILAAIGEVTASARQIERGNLDLVVPVNSRDELGQLAETFNAMAGRLREFRRTDRAKLVRTQRTTELALGSLPDAVAIISPDGSIELANDTARQLFGLNPDTELSAAPTAGLIELFRRAASERRPIQAKGYDAAIQIYNGQERFFLPSAVPVIDEDRNLAGVTLVLADVTNLRKLDEMKSGLLSVVSHELKNPLTSIRMAAHVLLEERIGTLNPKQLELLNAAREDAERLYKIIENLLDMGRMETGRGLVELKPNSPDSLIREAVDEVAGSFREKQVSLQADESVELEPVLADAERVRHVFSNLLTNALKYTPSGGKVHVWAEPDDQSVRFMVEDTGAGMSAEVIPRVFERFYRAPDQPGRSGAGLGLAIAREIIEVHGGKIWVDSSPGNGSRFTFTLKRADPDTPPEPK